MGLDSHTVHDLQWDELLGKIADYCYQPSAQVACATLEPITHRTQLEQKLGEMSEFYALYLSGHLPSGEFLENQRTLRVLQVNESTLVESDFQAIVINTRISNEWVNLYEQFKSHWTHLHSLFQGHQRNEALIVTIEEVFTPQWKVKDNASPELLAIRQGMQDVRKLIAKNFQKVVKDLQSKGLLAETEESFQNERRVLAVISSYKKQVNGIITGSSKTGSVTYIEPAINIPLNNELEMLKEEELREIRKILRELTQRIRSEFDYVKRTLNLLIHLDSLRAKARLGKLLNGIIPQFSDKPEFSIVDGIHPLLYLSHHEQKKPTFAQSVTLHSQQRILVISGPNAGGKSVTLKMIGLLQMMFQCAIPIPVHETSKLGIFHHFLTDIGDHQSIENQLSTYSYRLRRMKLFLGMANRRSLVLLDEFGTGSDPDLGGAMAEVFFEELYAKKTIGVITTHYNNIKLKAEELPHSINGNMSFDPVELAPLYKLNVGQAGSSFTFEVAQANGIDKELIERAKSKISHQKVKWDKLLSTMEAEKQKLQKASKESQLQLSQAQQTVEQFEKRKVELETKFTHKFQKLEKDTPVIELGKKMESFIKSVKGKNKNAELWEEMKKYILMENAKREQAKRKETIKKKKAQLVEEKITETVPLIPGDLVKIKQTRQTGRVEKVEDKGVTLIVGNFRTLIQREKLIKLPS